MINVNDTLGIWKFKVLQLYIKNNYIKELIWIYIQIGLNYQWKKKYSFLNYIPMRGVIWFWMKSQFTLSPTHLNVCELEYISNRIKFWIYIHFQEWCICVYSFDRSYRCSYFWYNVILWSSFYQMHMKLSYIPITTWKSSN